MDNNSKKPYRLGIALSGGGARGFAHVGALKAIEEAGLKPDIIAGVSAGSVIATLYAAGVTADDIIKQFSDLKFSDLSQMKLKGGGLFKLDKFKKFISKVLGPEYVNFEDLHIPTYVGVTDFDNGIPAVFSAGPIAEVVVASCSIPLLFQPVTINGVRYVDGGVLHNVPTWAIRDKCDFLIGVNCSPLTNGHKCKNTFMDVALRTYSLMVKSNHRSDMELCDLAIETPEVSSYRQFNLKEINQVFIRGYATAKAVLKHADLSSLKCQEK